MLCVCMKIQPLNEIECAHSEASTGVRSDLHRIDDRAASRHGFRHLRPRRRLAAIRYPGLCVPARIVVSAELQMEMGPDIRIRAKTAIRIFRWLGVSEA